MKGEKKGDNGHWQPTYSGAILTSTYGTELRTVYGSMLQLERILQ